MENDIYRLNEKTDGDDPVDIIDYTNKLADSIQKKIDDIIMSGDTNAEVVDARGEFNTLGNRLDNVDKNIVISTKPFETNCDIEDSANSKIKFDKIIGGLVQETRDGYNLFNVNDTKAVSSGITVDEEDWITITCDNSSGTSAIYQNYFTNNLNLKENTNYNIIAEIKKVSGTGSIQIVSSSSTSQFDQSMGYLFSNLSNGQTVQLNKLTKSDFTNTTQGIRTFCSFNAGESGSITFRISVLEDTTITSDNFVYVKFGKSPSLNYPSELKYVGGSYESYNKFTLDKGTYTNIGITANYNNSEFTINGTTTSSGNIFNKRDEINTDTYRLIGTFPAGKYIFKSELVSGNVKLPSGVNYALYLRSTNGTLVYDSAGRLSNYIEITLTEKITLYAQFFINGAGAVFNNCVVQCQITKGTEDKEYLPYGLIGRKYNVNSKNSDASLEQIYPLDLSNHPLYNESDCIYKQDNKLYVHNDFKKVNAKDLSWSMNDVGIEGITYKQFFAKTTFEPQTLLPDSIGKIFSNTFKTSSAGNNKENYMYIGNTGLLVCVAPKNANGNYITTLDEWKTAIQDTYFVGKLATPTETEITNTTLINQLEAIANMKTYKGGTHITFDDIGKIKGEYVVDNGLAEAVQEFNEINNHTDEEIAKLKESNVYSTEETICGSYKEKPLYRKHLEFTTGDVNNSNFIMLIPNIDNFMIKSCRIGAEQRPYNYAIENNKCVLDFLIYSNALTYRTLGTGGANTLVNLDVEYTKITD